MPANSMNVILFNKKLLSPRKKFQHRLGGYNSKKKTEYNLPKATNKQLRNISKRLKEERQIRMLKVIGLTFILFVLLVGALLYGSAVIRALLWY